MNRWINDYYWCNCIIDGWINDYHWCNCIIDGYYWWLLIIWYTIDAYEIIYQLCLPITYWNEWCKIRICTTNFVKMWCPNDVMYFRCSTVMLSISWRFEWGRYEILTVLYIMNALSVTISTNLMMIECNESVMNICKILFFLLCYDVWWTSVLCWWGTCIIH